MERSELLKKVRKIEIKAKGLSHNIFAVDVLVLSYLEFIIPKLLSQNCHTCEMAVSDV